VAAFLDAATTTLLRADPASAAGDPAAAAAGAAAVDVGRLQSAAVDAFSRFES
jgi:hypothetical protein